MFEEKQIELITYCDKKCLWNKMTVREFEQIIEQAKVFEEPFIFPIRGHKREKGKPIPYEKITIKSVLSRFKERKRIFIYMSPVYRTDTFFDLNTLDYFYIFAVDKFDEKDYDLYSLDEWEKFEKNRGVLAC